MPSDDARIHTGLRQAIALYNTGRRAEAEALCRRLDDGAGAHPAVLQLLAVLCQERGDAAAARPLILRSLALRPGHLPSLLVAALVHQDLHEPAAAQAALEQVLAQQPGHVAAAVNLGIVLLEQGRLDDALQHFGRAYRAQPASFGRIANALCAERCGALWLDADALRQRLSVCA